jgi:hypothetical protein
MHVNPVDSSTCSSVSDNRVSQAVDLETAMPVSSYFAAAYAYIVEKKDAQTHTFG